MNQQIGEFSAKGRAEYDRLWRARRPGKTVMDVERRERAAAMPPIPEELCGEAGCTFTPHEGEHSWGGAS